MSESGYESTCVQYPAQAAYRFFVYIEDEHEKVKNFKCLAECIYEWLNEPDIEVAAKDACGDFKLWLTMVALIFSEWQRPLPPEEKKLQEEFGPVVPLHISVLLCDSWCRGLGIFDPYRFSFKVANPT